MATAATFPGDVIVDGLLYSRGLAPNTSSPTAAITGAMLATNAGIVATQTVPQYHKVFSQAHGTAATAERRVIHVARGAGTLIAFRCGVVVANAGGATITVDLKKNGSTVLSSTTVIDTNTIYVPEAAAGFTSASYSADDVFEVAVTVAAGGGTLGQGLFCELVVREAA